MIKSRITKILQCHTKLLVNLKAFDDWGKRGDGILWFGFQSGNTQHLYTKNGLLKKKIPTQDVETVLCTEIHGQLRIFNIDEQINGFLLT